MGINTTNEDAMLLSNLTALASHLGIATNSLFEFGESQTLRALHADGSGMMIDVTKELPSNAEVGLSLFNGKLLIPAIRPNATGCTGPITVQQTNYLKTNIYHRVPSEKWNVLH